MLKQFPLSSLLDGELASAPTCDPLPVVPLAAPAISLSDVERHVIRFAQHDPISSIGPISRRERLVELAFGVRPATRLSDPRLEALRCFVIARRRGRGARTQLHAAGYSSGQVAQVEALAGRVGQTRGAPAWVSTLAVILALAAGSWEAFGYFRDLLVSMMLSGTGIVTLLPLLQRTSR